MSIVRVQKVYGDNIGFGGGPSFPITIGSTGAGEAIILTIGYDCAGVTNAPNVSSITDNKGNTYIQALNARGGSGQNACTDIWYCLSPAATGVFIVTVHFDGPCTRAGAFVSTYTGIEIYITAGSNPVTNSPCTSNAITPTASGTLLIGIAESTDVVLTGVNAPFTGDGRNTTDPVVWFEQIGAARTPQQAIMTPTTAGHNCASLAEFGLSVPPAPSQQGGSSGFVSQA